MRYSIVPGDRGKCATDVHVLGHPDSSAARQRSAVPERNDDGVDVVAVRCYEREITDVLLAAAHAITAGEIIEIRDRLIRAARQRHWIE